MSNKLCVLGLLLLCAVGARAQEPTRRQLVVPLPDAGFVGFRIGAAQTPPPASPPLSVNLDDVQAALWPQALLDGRDTIHRVLVDRAGAFVFGYDLVVEPLGATRQFRVSARPLSAEFAQRLGPRRPASAHVRSPAPPLATLPHATTVQTLDDGDAFALDLLVNPQTGVRITDEVKVAFDRARIWPLPPRDFTLDSVELAVRDYRLTVNGVLVGGGRPTRGAAGALIWFYVPGRGRFICSLAPRPGYDFQKLALIEDNTISFVYRGDRYELTSSAAVVGAGGAWYVWLLPDPDYTPELAAPAARTEAAASAPPASPLADTIAGRTPRTQPQTGYNPKPARSPQPQPNPLERVRIGAADRMENLWPKQ